MLTTKRSGENSYFSDERSGSVDLLERNVPDTYAQYINTEKTEVEEDFETAKERMQKNLDLIMNYDKVEQEEKAEVEEIVDERQSTPEISISDDDIRPTSTTLQFGEGNIDQMYSDMKMFADEEKTGHRLSVKNKVIIAIYSLVVAAILTLIVMNTSVLAMIRSENAAKVELLNSRVQQYTALTNEIQEISSNEHVVDLAENEYGMIKGN